MPRPPHKHSLSPPPPLLTTASAINTTTISTEKPLRAAQLRLRFADTIVKASEVMGADKEHVLRQIKRDKDLQRENARRALERVEEEARSHIVEIPHFMAYLFSSPSPEWKHFIQQNLIQVDICLFRQQGNNLTIQILMGTKKIIVLGIISTVLGTYTSLSEWMHFIQQNLIQKNTHRVEIWLFHQEGKNIMIQILRGTKKCLVWMRKWWSHVDVEGVVKEIYTQGCKFFAWVETCVLPATKHAEISQKVIHDRAHDLHSVSVNTCATPCD